jgi:hypothetical protein
MSTPKSMEQMVREIDARQQIHDCIMRYCRGVDHCDPDLALSAYHPDATDCHGFFAGTAAQFVDAAMQAGSMFEVIRHVICNEYVEFDQTNANVAFAETVTIGCILTREGDEYRLAVSSCRFLDRFEGRDGVWKIAARDLVLDWETEGPARGLAGGPLTSGMVRGFANPSDPSFGLGFRKWGPASDIPVVRQRVGVTE